MFCVRTDGDGPQYRGFNLSGSVMLGAALYNPTCGARPDNTGLALFRYAGHLDVDLLDFIAGLTSTQDLGKISFEEGVRSRRV